MHFCSDIGVVYRPDHKSKLGLWLEQSKACHWWFPYKGIVLASERHNVVEVDTEGRIHCDSGPACSYPDNIQQVFAVHGVRVPRYVIMEPTTITLKSIESETNAEIKRIMIDRFGAGRYLQESGTRKIHSDSFGNLYRKELPGDPEPMVMAEVLSSTPEPDGVLTRAEALEKFSPETPVRHEGMMLPLVQVPECLRFKSYFIRVPPTMQRTRQAIAWTFGLDENDYSPCMET